VHRHPYWQAGLLRRDVWWGKGHLVRGGRDRVEPLIVDEAVLDDLESRLVLTFTGESHFSGSTNWSMFSGYINGSPGVRQRCVRSRRRRWGCEMPFGRGSPVIRRLTRP